MRRPRQGRGPGPHREGPRQHPLRPWPGLPVPPTGRELLSASRRGDAASRPARRHRRHRREARFSVPDDDRLDQDPRLRRGLGRIPSAAPDQHTPRILGRTGIAPERTERQRSRRSGPIWRPFTFAAQPWVHDQPSSRDNVMMSRSIRTGSAWEHRTRAGSRPVFDLHPGFEHLPINPFWKARALQEYRFSCAVRPGRVGCGHSTTSSARARIDGGIVSPSSLAVFRLTANS